MRGLACVASLSVLLTWGCSGADGPRAGGAGAGSSGSPTMTTGGASATAGSPNSGGVASTGGAPVTTAGTTGTAGQGGTAPVGGDVGAHVITWVPPYLVNESKQALEATFDGMGMHDGLSYLALQFWITDGPGTRLDQVSDADIKWFHDWAKQHGVKILLCTHNHINGEWNWPEAMRAFKDNRDAFVQHLVSQVTTHDLDGVDVDLEGIVDPTLDDQQSYLQFVQALSGALRPLGKTLTVDSFHGQWNAPNWNWWPDLLPLVDGITSMGYEQSGMGVDYQELVDHAVAAPHKLMIGVPSYHGTWLGHGVGEQLGWLVQQGQVGTAIWDASLRAPEWRQRAVWDQLKTIKAR